jgi:nitrate reductase alpha subunit
MRLWREARAIRTPVAAWASIVEDAEKRKSYTSKRGLGGFVRASWDEVNEIIAAANAYTAKTYGPDRVIGLPIATDAVSAPDRQSAPRPKS